MMEPLYLRKAFGEDNSGNVSRPPRGVVLTDRHSTFAEEAMTKGKERAAAFEQLSRLHCLLQLLPFFLLRRLQRQSQAEESSGGQVHPDPERDHGGIH